MAATNRRDILDPALLRPGRFDRQVTVGYPDIDGREAILKVHARNKPIAPDVDMKTVAKSTVGFTGADLENLLNEAALQSAKKNKKAITMKEIEDAAIKVVAGPEKKSHKVSDKDKKLTAYHEAGHAICHFYCPTQDPVHEVSIIPRGAAGGYTLALPVEDRNYVTKNEMTENIVTLLGGRAAEKIVLDDVSTGASNDIERATKIANSMITRYGFSDKIGPIVYGANEDEIFIGRDYGHTRNYSENVAAAIDTEVRALIDSCYEKAQDILKTHEDQLHSVAGYLIEKEKISGDDFVKIMNGELVLEKDKKDEPDDAGESGETGIFKDAGDVIDGKEPEENK
ncbi:MAG: ATP-dependent zinc metalloprotease FtsH, partial [Oscillospiraceae bacterium]|nr:ATP-dependent zinc metalloprotease FtsH [Oscillospiraceae bacterium]